MESLNRTVFPRLYLSRKTIFNGVTSRRLHVTNLRLKARFDVLVNLNTPVNNLRVFLSFAQNFRVIFADNAPITVITQFSALQFSHCLAALGFTEGFFTS